MEKESDSLTEEREIFKNYMSSVMHDLRSPLFTMVGYQNLILGGGITLEEIIEFTKVGKDLSNRMLKMIEIYLLLEKIERGVKAIEMTSITIVELVNILKGVISDVCLVNKVNFNLDIRGVHDGLVNYKKKLLINDILIISLFTNLLENAAHSALTYAEVDNKIIVNLFESDKDFIVSITNHGEIPVDIRDKIFQKFYTTKKNGNGLGLYTAKIISEAHHGNIIYEPSVGQTRFIVKIPFK